MIKELEKQAEAFLRQNQLADAEAVYQQICALESNNAFHWLTLGDTRQRLGLHGEAEASIRHALTLSPDLAAAHHVLGVALQKQGRLTEAISSYHKATRLDPACAETLYYLANALRETGDTDAAVKAYQRLLQVEPGHFEGLNNLGILLLSLGDSNAALPYLRRALQLQPDNMVTLTSLGDACVTSGFYEEALKHLQHAVNKAPASARAWYALASAQHQAGKLQEALASYDTLASLLPESPDAALGQARILEQLGKYRAAYELLNPLLETGHADAIFTFFNISKHLDMREEAIAALKGLLVREHLEDDLVAATHFKLGRHYDETGEYDNAFQHFQQANQLTQADFNAERLIRFIDDNIAVYNREFIGQMSVAGNHSELPVFILGMPRTGTSLVEQILASHPDVTGAGELSLVPEIVQRLAADFPGYVYPLYAPRLAQQSLNITAEHHLQALQTLGGTATRVTDKLPHNFRNIGLIAQLFPAARIIHCTKHPLDTCLSCYFAQFGTTAHGYTYNLKTVGEYYLQYRRLMEHWLRVFPERILTVSYRELVLDQEKTTRRLIEFCGLDWDERCLDFHNTDRFIFTLSYDQVRQPLYTRSLDRWKHYQAQLEPLCELLAAGGVELD